MSCNAWGEAVDDDGAIKRTFDFFGSLPDETTVTVQSQSGDVLLARTVGIAWSENEPHSSCPSGSTARISLEHDNLQGAE